MKAARQQIRKAEKAQSKRTADIGCTGTKKSTKKTGGRCYKSAGQAEQFLVYEDKRSPPSTTADQRRPELPDESRCYSQKPKGSPPLELYPGQTLLPHAKIKLQLFPIDEGTRIGLEKDGYYPYLELTLSPRKKISSVLKHLNSKWGSSSIALGELMLFPYNMLENVSSYRRWTLNDNDISAQYVYEAVGNPAIFRLRCTDLSFSLLWASNDVYEVSYSVSLSRYGWFSFPESEAFGMLSTSTPIQDFSQSEGLQKGCSSINIERPYGKSEKIGVRNEEFKDINLSQVSTAVVDEKVVHEPINPVDNKLRIDGGVGQSSTLWDDSLTNISIGGLLSEASLQGKFNNFDPITDGLTNISIGGLLSLPSLQGKFSNTDPKLAGTDAGLQPTQLISDSFDAYIASETNCLQAPRPSAQDPCSSILDAEETCHAFPFRRFSSSGKDDLPLVGSAYRGGCNQVAGSKSFPHPSAPEVNGQAGFTRDHSEKESETNLLLCSRTYNDESSLGLSGIKWTDSLGPFDLGLPASQKLVSGDSITKSGFVR
ncbi:TSL-kinase interacting protein 1 [Morella rubra]|uniref:TSL-kinase interacting protein 1 n=1 Tax=Morella rubra TaxID=262757 RepID=A0A6A1VCE9_9ROSI|nr:TSL-kinase interacting protein 1 [Morella rubra]